MPDVGQYRANVIGRLGKGVAMNKLRTLADVLRQAGFARITGLFLIFYLLCSTAVWLSEPTTLTFGDGLWFSFETVSTIGFGDIPAETPVARAITVVLSVISIFYIAMLTGVAVNYCNTLIKMRQKDTMARPRPLRLATASGLALKPYRPSALAISRPRRRLPALSLSF